MLISEQIYSFPLILVIRDALLAITTRDYLLKKHFSGFWQTKLFQEQLNKASLPEVFSSFLVIFYTTLRYLKNGCPY